MIFDKDSQKCVQCEESLFGKYEELNIADENQLKYTLLDYFDTKILEFKMKIYAPLISCELTDPNPAPTTPGKHYLFS